MCLFFGVFFVVMRVVFDYLLLSVKFCVSCRISRSSGVI